MSTRRLASTLLAAAALPLAAAVPAQAGQRQDHGHGHGQGQGQGQRIVYTSTNAADGNAVLVFTGDGGGGLRPAGAFATGGSGTGAGLGNQGALALDRGRLYAVNAGSGDISVFDARRDRLVLRQRVGSGGSQPISLTISGRTLYALNAGGTGGISGFRIAGDGLLRPIPGATQPLAGAGPAQIAFSPDGRTLVVTEKATDTIDTFAVGPTGTPAPAVSRASSGATPFGFDFDPAGHAIVSEAHGGAAGASTVSSYGVAGGTFTTISASVPDFQGAACWVEVTRHGRYAYVANTGSNNVSTYRIAADGSISLLDADGVTAPAGAAPADVAEGGHRGLYVRNGGDGTISSYRRRHDGSLVPTGAVGGVPAGATGLVAD